MGLKIRKMGLGILLFSTLWAIPVDKIKNCYYRSYNYEKMGDYRDAIKALIPVYREYPRGYTINLRLGWLYYLNRNYLDSEKHYKEAMRTIPSSLEPRLGLMGVYLAMGRFSDLYQQGIAIFRYDLYNYYGNYYYLMGLEREKRLEEAVQICRKMLTVYPTDTTFLSHLGVNLIKLGQGKEGKKRLSDTLILDPENIIARRYLSNESISSNQK